MRPPFDTGQPATPGSEARLLESCDTGRIVSVDLQLVESYGADMGDTEELDEALRAIAEPRRRQILDLVRERERTVGEIAGHFDVSRPAISQHLAVLEQAGLVTVAAQGTRRLVRARPEGMAQLRDYIEGFWTERLAALKDAAEQVAVDEWSRG
jgi:DNA-binding transcriptional ArsR family regulator